MNGLVFMDDDFEWRTEEGSDPPPAARPHDRGRALRRLLTVALLLAALGGVWWTTHRAADTQRATERAAIQTTLDAARDACRAGDGAAFFATQTRDPAWQAALLQPDLIAAYCAGPTVSRSAPATDGTVSANLTWSDGGETRQRLAFFAVSPAGMVQVPPPAAYWGDAERHEHSWGTLIVSATDAEFAATIGRHLDELIATTCAGSCLPDRPPLTLDLRGDYRTTAAPNELNVPSPRLLALDEMGAPAPAFWTALDATVADYLTPATIRFAVPPLLQQVVAFEREAAVFMRHNPDIRVEIVPRTLPPGEPTAELATFDGAAYTPSAAMIAAGLVHDLTGFAGTDPTFAPGDFYEQAWQSGYWRNRLWLVPLAGQMRVLFLDCAACDGDGPQPPSLRWTWDEMDATLTALKDAPPPSEAAAPTWSREWALLDTTRDTLLSYAYSGQAACAGVVPARCERPLGPTEIAAALEWYRRQTVDLQTMPDVAGVDPAERTRLMVNWQSGSRRAALWVDDPVNYESQLLLGRVAVLPFPGSDRFDGNTPYWVHGAFISSASPRPRAVWRWLVFLSQRPVVGPLRYVPARPSVAEATAFWTTLPAPVGEAMRAAFPFARPVGFDDRFRFNREQLTAVTSGRLSPGEAARMPIELPWFAAVRSPGLVTENLRQE